MQESNYQIDKGPLQEFPLPLVSLKKQQKTIVCIDEILQKYKMISMQI